MTNWLDGEVPEIAAAVQSGETSASDLLNEALARANAAAALNAYLALPGEAAQKSAELIDARQRRGERLGKLAGVPVAIKDALCTVDLPTTSGSKILCRDGHTHASGFRPAYDATVVARLRAADALIFGKTNMDEFAMGSSTENSAFGPAHNPWDATRTPGGSSGGSAAAVAARTAPAALGSDTGGSIRQPAGLCGVVGVKPSYGRVSRFGLVAFASSLDQVGPFTTTVRGAARLLEVIAGHDARDATSHESPVGMYEAACQREIRGLRIGIPKEYFETDGLDDDVRHVVENAIEGLKSLGCSTVEVSLPHTHLGVSTYYIVATAEASSNLSRFDGVRFGYRAERSQQDLAELYSASREHGFGAEVKRRIMLGTYALSSGYYDAYYRKAQQARSLIRRDFANAFQQADVLLTPSSPTPAFRLGEKVTDPLQMYLADIYTVPASLAGIAALTLPAGFSDASSERRALPVGVQLLAPAFEEERLFSAAAAWERISPARGHFPNSG